MTLSPFIIYLWGIADNLCGLFVTLAIAATAATLGCLASTCESRDKDFDVRAFRRATKFALTALCMAALWALTPSSKTLAIMVVAPAIVNSKPIQQDLPEVYSLAVDALKQSLKDVAIEQAK